MQRITESILINLPAKKVFAFLRNVEGRMRLNPFYRLLAFEKLTVGEVGVGTRFRIVILNGNIRSEYVSEVQEFLENKRIVTRDVNGRLKVTLTLEETADGTIMTHDEEFVIPEVVLYPLEDKDKPLWLRIFENILRFDSIKFIDREKEERIEEIKETLRNNLRRWLSKIKDTLEHGSRGD